MFRCSGEMSEKIGNGAIYVAVILLILVSVLATCDIVARKRDAVEHRRHHENRGPDTQSIYPRCARFLGNNPLMYDDCQRGQLQYQLEQRSERK